MFNTGDKIVIREWEDMEREFGINENGNIPCKCVFTRGMKRMCGREYTIEDVCIKDEHDGGVSYRLKEIPPYAISEDMIDMKDYQESEEMNLFLMSFTSQESER